MREMWRAHVRYLKLSQERHGAVDTGMRNCRSTCASNKSMDERLNY